MKPEARSQKSEVGSQKSEVGSQKSEVTLVCFAMKEEAVVFRKMLAGSPQASILITGIGRRNAENAVQNFLQEHSPAFVLTCGFAGGLDPALCIGDLVYFTEDQMLGGKLRTAGARPARFFCADRIAITVAEKRQLREASGADVVEMESAVIHDVCHRRGIPCATVRVISDTANEDLPLDFNKLAGPDMNLDFGRLALAIARSPGKIGGLMRLQKQARIAADALAKVLAKVVELR